MKAEAAGMTAPLTAVPLKTLATFAAKLAGWGTTLDRTEQAMLVDLLAKAGGETYGAVAMDRSATPDGREAYGGTFSPLESGDMEAVLQGIFAADREDGAG
jgi:hypothetical protein